MPEDPVIWHYPEGDRFTENPRGPDMTDRICPLFAAALKQAGRPYSSGTVLCLDRECAWYEKCSKT